MFVASEPASGSVSARQPVSSPLAMRGNQRCFCASVPSATSASGPIPVFGADARNAIEHCDSSNAASTSSSVVRPGPP